MYWLFSWKKLLFFSLTPKNSVVLSWSSAVLLARSLFLHFVHRSLEARITSSALFVFLPFGSKEEFKNTPIWVFPMPWNKRTARWKCYSLKIYKTFQLQLNLGFRLFFSSETGKSAFLLVNLSFNCKDSKCILLSLRINFVLENRYNLQEP